MHLLWRDNFESFLDASAPDASGSTSFASTLGSDTGLFSGQSLLWTGNSASPLAPTDVNTVSLGGFDAGTANLPSLGSGLTGQDVLWTEPRSSTATWQLADNFGDAGAAGLGTPNLPLAAGSMPTDLGSLVWESTLFRFEMISAFAHSSAVDSALNQALDLLWTATGGTGAPPVTLPHAPTNPFVDGSLPFFLPPSGFPPTNELFPNAPGTPPVTPPIVNDSPPINVVPGSTFAALAPQQLVWTDPSQGVPTTLTEPPGTGVTPLNTLFGRS